MPTTQAKHSQYRYVILVIQQSDNNGKLEFNIVWSTNDVG